MTRTDHIAWDLHHSATLTCEGTSYRFIALREICGDDLARLPVVLRLLLENVLRNTQGPEREAAAGAIGAWLDTGTSVAEIAFQPDRVLMHDTTSTPALVDIAAMRNTLAEGGVDPGVLNPVLRVDVSVDHSLAVQVYAQADAAAINLQHELRRNLERYRFLRWASTALANVRIHPPGTGIMHTINLEQLATVATLVQRDGESWVVPDMMIGTDSHTPMINGIGVLGWGVGGLEAQTVMFGMPTMLRVPEVIGVRLHGRMPPGAMATDLALLLTQRLRALDVTGQFVEYFGPGVSTLTAGERCVVANMAPEYGATTAFFPVDAQTLRYLRDTGRDAAHVQLVEQHARLAGLWFEPQEEPRYTRVLDLDLSTVSMSVAGPRRPQDLLSYADAPQALANLGLAARGSQTMPQYPIAIAAITSCTNTSDPRLLVAAGLLARRARALGLQVRPWVKTSLAPGSPAAATYLERAGLLADLGAMGFDIVGFGCTTCIGNSGALPDMVQSSVASRSIYPVAALSGNRNFTGRIHPELDLAYLMSPPLVIAYALAGDAMRNLAHEPVQRVGTTEIYLADIWPTNEEVDAVVAQATRASDYSKAFIHASANPAWDALTAPSSALFPWDSSSTTLRRPPFASGAAEDGYGSQLGTYTAYPLLVLGDDVTTDHISPASAIPSDSLVADFLVERGERRDDLNVFASRRGNWEVMLRAAFYSKGLKNWLHADLPVAHTLHVPSGEVGPIWEVAERYRAEGDAVVLIAGERYGTGSSRDWAAKGQRLLGIRAVLAVSFERIHRANLIGMGVLPLRLSVQDHPRMLALMPGDRLVIDADPAALEPRATVPVSILRHDGSTQVLHASAAVETQLEVELLKMGGVIPAILKQTSIKRSHV